MKRQMTPILWVVLLVGVFWLAGCQNATIAEKTAGPYRITLETAKQPLKSGPDNFSLRIDSTGGVLPNDLQAQAKLMMPAMSTMSVPNPVLQKTGEGQYSGKGDFMMAGDWKLTVLLKSGTDPVVSTDFDVKVAE